MVAPNPRPSQPARRHVYLGQTLFEVGYHSAIPSGHGHTPKKVDVLVLDQTRADVERAMASTQRQYAAICTNGYRIYINHVVWDYPDTDAVETWLPLFAKLAGGLLSKVWEDEHESHTRAMWAGELDNFVDALHRAIVAVGKLPQITKEISAWDNMAERVSRITPPTRVSWYSTRPLPALPTRSEPLERSRDVPLKQPGDVPLEQLGDVVNHPTQHVVSKFRTHAQKKHDDEQRKWQLEVTGSYHAWLRDLCRRSSPHPILPHSNSPRIF